MLYLLVQVILSSPDCTENRGVATPWTQYFGLLPAQVPVPTMWTEYELSYLKGTSLEASSPSDDPFDCLLSGTSGKPATNPCLARRLC